MTRRTRLLTRRLYPGSYISVLTQPSAAAILACLMEFRIPRLLAASLVALVLAAIPAAARAACPDCVPGNGPAATDCFLEWRGVPSNLRITCTDGAASDADGRFDGTCTVALTACGAVEGTSGCMPLALTGAPTVKPGSSPAAKALAGALAGMGTAGEECRDASLPFPTATARSGTKVKKTRLVAKAQAGPKRDVDKFAIVTQPALLFTLAPGTAPPSFANDVQPIFTERCAIPACHSGSSPSAGQNLEAGQAYGTSVNQPSVNSPKLVRVVPGSVRNSYLARKILGQGVTDGSAVMPQGCPGLPPAGGVVHCFTGDWAAARAYLDLGLLVSVAGVVTFRNAGAVREAVRRVPRDRLLVETDSPYLAPVPHRGRRNEPAHVAEVARAVAAIWGVPPEEAAAVTAENALRLFRIAS